jgi:hypothetical protein
VAKRSPLESLIRIAQPPVLVRPTLPGVLAPDALALAWQNAIDATRAQLPGTAQGRGMFWYLRKRQLPYTAEVSSATLRLAGNAAAIDQEVDLRLRRAADPLQLHHRPHPTLARADHQPAGLVAAGRLAHAGRRPTTSDLLRHSKRAEPAGRQQDKSLSHDVLNRPALATAPGQVSTGRRRNTRVPQAPSWCRRWPTRRGAAADLYPRAAGERTGRLRRAAATATSTDPAKQLAQLAGLPEPT